MRPYLLTETNWKKVSETNYEIAVLPWGATEAHNFHLPYGTDNIEAEQIAAESAKIAWENGVKVVVLPNIPYGVNTGQSDIKLTMNIYPSTQLVILHDIIETLNNQGIHKFMILNSHGGNDFKPILRELGRHFPDMFLCCCNWFQALNKAEYFELNGDHADEMETSIMLHLSPELVLPLSDAGVGKALSNRMKQFSEGWVWAERRWTKVSADTGIGNPKLATKEKGQHYFKNVSEKIATLIQDLSKTDLNNLYE
jgi:creatinine amidohydrolase